MKKLSAMILATLLTLSLLTGCGGQDSSSAGSSTPESSSATGSSAVQTADKPLAG